MSAADLFRDAHDVSFRLLKTHIVIGKKPFKIVDCISKSHYNLVQDVSLHLIDDKGKIIEVPLHNLPLSSMTSCPYGYFNERWYARGPARHRYQGITSSSLWGIDPDGRINLEGVYDVMHTLAELVKQPRIRPASKRPQGILTRDVKITSDKEVHVRGRKIGHYIKDNVVEAEIPLTDLSKYLLSNARLEVKEMEKV